MYLIILNLKLPSAGNIYMGIHNPDILLYAIAFAILSENYADVERVR